MVAAVVGALGGLAMVFGSIMPWVTARTMFGSMSIPGTDGDGVLTLFAGAVLSGLAAATVVQRMWVSVVSLVAAVAAAAFVLYQLFSIAIRLADASSQYASASVGIGLYVLLVGSVTCAGAAAYQVLERHL